MLLLKLHERSLLLWELAEINRVEKTNMAKVTTTINQDIAVAGETKIEVTTTDGMPMVVDSIIWKEWHLYM